MAVVLMIDKGPGAGARFELVPQAYRAVGRGGDHAVTLTLSEAGERQLDAEDLALVKSHIENREPAEPSESGDFRIDSFGRGADILIHDESISKTHAMFFLDARGPSVVDLMSTNGTHVNGERVANADLAEGDIINVGKTRFVVECD